MAPHLPQLVDAGSDQQLPYPTFEPFRVAQVWQAPPSPDERFLDDVPRTLAVADDQASRRIETADRQCRELPEGITIAASRPNHEIYIHQLGSLDRATCPHTLRRSAHSHGSKIAMQPT
jgi:hypothetical protein